MSALTNEIRQELRQTDPPEASEAPANVPDIVRIGSLPTNLEMSIDTDITQPVVISQNFCRIVLENKGLLHSNSKITFSMAQSDSVAYMPLGTGAFSVLERCTLKCGTRTINEIDDFAHYESYRSTFIASENMLERETVTTGRAIAYDFDYNNLDNTESDFIRLDVGREVDNDNSGDTTLPDYMLLPQKAEYQINISSLFPFLKMNQIPLYLLREQVSIELVFKPLAPTKATSARMCVRQGESTTGADFNVDLDSIRMIADYIYYPTELMDAFAKQNTNMTMSYMDYRLSKQSLTSSTNASNINNIRNVGGNGKIVTKLIVGLSDDSKSQGLLNQYNSMSCYNGDAFSASLISNVKYNGNFLYPIDVNSYARHFHNVQQAEGTQPFLTKSMYSGETDDFTDGELEGHDQDGALESHFFRQSYRLNRGERVNSRGIELSNNYTLMDDGSGSKTYTQRCWVESAKLANISNGVIVCYDA